MTSTNSSTKVLTSALVVGGSAVLFAYYIYRTYRPKKEKIQRTERTMTLKRYKRGKLKTEQIEKKLNKFNLDQQTLRQIMELFERDLKKGLDPFLNSESELKMLPTFVCNLPSGKECGDILALDLGGSNFRVVLIQLQPGTKPKKTDKVFILSERLIKGSGEALFDYIAQCLSQFIHIQGLGVDKTHTLGFTFSFPVQHTSLSKAVLIRWTKGFSCTDTIDKDVVELLQHAIDKRGDIKVKVAVLINDTVGTLMSCAYNDPNTAVGLIMGTGTNACYFESIKNIKKLNDIDFNNNGVTKNSQEMLVNTELGAFGENGSIDFLRTAYDDEVDKTSLNVGMQIFEKMASGMYLGELVRLIILDLIDAELIFQEEMKLVAYRHALFTKGSFYAKYLDEIESDSELTYTNTRRIIRELAGIEKASHDDYAVIKYVCELVTERAARLIASALAVIINRLNRQNVTIAVDGSLFRYHPYLQLSLEATLEKLINPNIEFNITLSVDGSGRGAAVLAASEKYEQ